MAALRRQWSEAQRTELHRAAYKAGLRNWKRIYVRRQLAATRQSRSGAAIGDLLKVALAAPDQLLSLAVGALARGQARKRL